MLRDQLIGKTREEKVTLKSDAIVDKFNKKKIKESDIEIVEVNKIDGGVEILARAWKDGKQIGFGENGTVDIERFRIFNPPIIVPDENGDIVRTFTDSITGEVTTTHYREDPEAAMLEVIRHNISVMKRKSDDKNIIADKRGNTTSVFYPDANIESTTVDGYVTASDASWATVRGAISGTANDSATQTGSEIQASLFSGTYYIGRGFFLFDTAGLIPDGDTITSATFSQYGVSSTSDADSTTFEVVQTSPASDTALASGDYNNLTFTSGGSRALSSAAGYRNIALNSTGLTWINKTGITKLGLIIGLDLSNTAPTGLNRDNFYLADEGGGGVTTDPKLVVEHSAINTTNFFLMMQ